MKKNIFITAFVLLLASFSASAQDALVLDEIFYKGVMAYRLRDIPKAKAYWERAADRGHALAMYSLGRLYQYGDLGSPDLEAAEKWHREAAIRGVTPAQYQLAKLLLDQQEAEEAAHWMSESAMADYVAAQHDLAVMYEEGTGVKPSMESAAKWYLEAAENGSMPAQFKLVTMYMEGKGVEQNDQKAFEWATKASESGDPNAKYLLGYMFYTGTGTVTNLEMAEVWLREAIAEGQSKAKKLLEEVKKKQQANSKLLRLKAADPLNNHMETDPVIALMQNRAS